MISNGTNLIPRVPDLIVAVFSNVLPKETHSVLYRAPGRPEINLATVSNQEAAELLTWLEKSRKEKELNPELAKAGSIKIVPK